MEISVIIPTFKPAQYLWECLESLRNQTLDKTRYEIVLVLNGCCEPFHSRIQDYLSTHFEGYSVTFFQTDIPGVSNARNLAIESSKGDYITFLDDDDSLSPSCLEEMLSVAQPDSVVECYPYAYKDGEKDNQLSDPLTDAYNKCVLTDKNTINGHARKFFSGPCMKLIHKDIIGNRKFDVRFRNGEDSIYMFLISDRINRVILTSKDAVYYRRYRHNSAISKERSLEQKIVNCFRCMYEYTRIYFKGRYSISFYTTRILAEFKSILLYCCNKK